MHYGFLQSELILIFRRFWFGYSKWIPHENKALQRACNDHALKTETLLCSCIALCLNGMRGSGNGRKCHRDKTLFHKVKQQTLIWGTLVQRLSNIGFDNSEYTDALCRSANRETGTCDKLHVSLHINMTWMCMYSREREREGWEVSFTPRLLTSHPELRFCLFILDHLYIFEYGWYESTYAFNQRVYVFFIFFSFPCS